MSPKALLLRIAFFAPLALSTISSCRAAIITVASTDDSGPGSLRDAVASATDEDTIDVSGVSGTIILTSGELLVTNSVDIIGPGPDQLAVNGNAARRVFHIGSGKTVTISSLTVTNGFSAGGSGGGIWNEDGTITVSNCVVAGNSGFGGGIFNGSLLGGTATARILDSTLSGNRGHTGGAIINYVDNGGDATLQVTHSVLISNQAELGCGIANRVQLGGGMASVQIIGSIISGNSSYGEGLGGAIESINFSSSGVSGFASVEIRDSTLSDNQAFIGGGGVYNDNASLRIVSSTLSGNFAIRGGGIHNIGYFPGTASVEIVNSTLSGNLAGFGGGIFNNGFEGNVSLRVLNSTLSDNQALAGTDGGIYNDSFVGSATVEVGNSILRAGGGSPSISNFLGTVTSLGYNLSSDDDGGFLTATGDQINTDPMLGPLQDNGGPTFTHALLPGSPAVNAGDPNFDPNAFAPPLLYDQRGPGFPRVVCGRIDIGAFEVQDCTSPVIEQIDDLIALVNGLPGVTAAMKNALVVKLNAAQKVLRNGNNWSACSNLKDFINLVSAQAGKKQITRAQATLLNNEATRIRVVLACP